MGYTPQEISEIFQSLDDDDDEDVLSLLISSTTADGAVPQEGRDRETESNSNNSAYNQISGLKKSSRSAVNETLEQHSCLHPQNSNSIGSRSTDFTSTLFSLTIPNDGSNDQPNLLNQAYEAYIQAQIDNIDKICKEYTELTACEAQVDEFETEIVEFHRALDVTDAIDLMQEQIEEVLRRKRHRQQVSDSLNEVYSALQEVDSFCEWIVKNHARQQVDETYLSYLRRLGVKLTFLSRHKALHHSAVDDEIRPKLTAAAELAGNKILQYMATRIQQVRWEASPPTILGSPTKLNPAASSFSTRSADAVDGGTQQESKGQARTFRSQGNSSSKSNSSNRIPSGEKSPHFSGTSRPRESSFSGASFSTPLSSKGKARGTKGDGGKLNGAQGISMSMDALHDSLEQGEYYGFSFLKLYNPPVAKRIVTLYLQRGAEYYQKSFSAAWDQLKRSSRDYHHDSNSHRPLSTIGIQDGMQKPANLGGGEHGRSRNNAYQDESEKKANRPLTGSSGDDGSASLKPREEHGSVGHTQLGVGGSGKEGNFSSCSFLCPSSTLQQEIESWEKIFSLSNATTSSKGKDASFSNQSPKLSEMAGNLDVVGFLHVLNAIHLKYGKLHYEGSKEKDGEREKVRGSTGLTPEGSTNLSASPHLWLPHFISFILLLVNTCTEECRFIGNFFCLAETQDGAVENYNDAEKVAKLLLEPLIDHFQPLLHSCLPQFITESVSTISLHHGQKKRQYFLDSLSAIRVLELCKAYLSTSQDPIPLLLLSGLLESCRSILRSPLASVLKAELTSFSQEVRNVSAFPFLLCSDESTTAGIENLDKKELKKGIFGLPPFVWSAVLSIWSLDILNTATLRASTFHMEVPQAIDRATDRFCVAASHLVVELIFRLGNVTISTVRPEEVESISTRKDTNGGGRDSTCMSVPASVSTAAYFLLLTLQQARHMVRYRLDAPSDRLIVVSEINCGGKAVYVWNDAIEQALALQPWFYTAAPQLSTISQWWWQWKANLIARSVCENSTLLGMCTSTSNIGVDSTLDSSSGMLSCRTLGAYSIVVPSFFYTGNSTDLFTTVQNRESIRASARTTSVNTSSRTWRELSQDESQILEDLARPLCRGEVMWTEELRGIINHLRSFLECAKPAMPTSMQDSKSQMRFSTFTLSKPLTLSFALPSDVIEVFAHGVLLPLLRTFPEAFLLTKAEEEGLKTGKENSVQSNSLLPPSANKKEGRKGNNEAVEKSRATHANAPPSAEEVTSDVNVGESTRKKATPSSFETAIIETNSTTIDGTPSTVSTIPSLPYAKIASATKEGSANEIDKKDDDTGNADSLKIQVSEDHRLSVASLQHFLQSFATEQSDWSSHLVSPKKNKKKKKKIISPVTSNVQESP